MKSGTESKSKFKQLKRKLKLKYWQVVGVLETLWRVTQNDAPAGDIGKLDNEEIAEALEWEGDANSLIDALIETHWLDEDDEFRLIVHDWSEHAPNHLQGAFKKHGRQFADQIAKQRTKQVARDHAKHDAQAPCPSTVLSAPCHLTKPNQTNSNPANQPLGSVPSGRPAAGLAGGLDSWDFDSEVSVKLSLESVGYKRVADLIGECREAGKSPRDIISVVNEFRANNGKLTSPGAIAEKLRSGFWPVDNVLPAEKAAANRSKAAEEKRRISVEAIRMRLVREVDNDARNWSDDKVIEMAKELQAKV
jgi:hypothetical protein